MISKNITVSKNNIISKIKASYRNYIVYIVFVILLLFFSFTLGGRGFFTLQNLNNIIVQTAVISMLSVGLVFAFSAGMNDLSIGANLALSGLIAAYILRSGGGIFQAVSMALGMGLVLGMTNGALVTWGNLPPWLATVGTQTIIRGTAMFIMDSDYGVEISNETFLKIFAQGTVLGVPAIFIWTVAVVTFGYLLLYKHKFGARVLATGGNETSAKYSGINTHKIKIMCMILCGVLASTAGVINAARLSSARYTVGDGIESSVIAAVVLGGTSMNGGKGNIFGALVGSLLIGMINAGLIIGGLTSSQQLIVRGTIIIVALLLGEKDK
ncbi:MAG: ABC transporter permease [Clostridiales bacterium]|jgi:ribose transport system permease protein|nr:ABC transporter permease [Clostridiales bacterium]